MRLTLAELKEIVARMEAIEANMVEIVSSVFEGQVEMIEIDAFADERYLETVKTIGECTCYY